MSAENVKTFIEKMKSDVIFRKQVLAIGGVDARMEFIKKKGFECKVGDIQLYLHHFVGQDGNEVVTMADKSGGCNKIWYGFCF